MRVAHIITRMIIGGAQENTLFNCLDLVNDFGDEVVLLTGPALGPEGRLLEQGRAGGLRVEMIDSLRRAIDPVQDWKAYRELLAAIDRIKPDVVHTHSAKGGFLGRAAAWKRKVPAVVHTVHGAPFHPYQGVIARNLFIALEKWAAKRCHHMISVANAMTDLMVRAGVAGADKFTTIYSGMDVEPFSHCGQFREAARCELGIPTEKVVFGKIARLFHLKGHEYLIAAARKVIDANPNCIFLLVGDGILREQYEREIQQLKMKSHFIFTGLVPPERIPFYLSAMDALVHTSLREGLARTLPQALIAGKPVISYDVDGAREVVLPNSTGYLLQPKAVEPLAEAILALAESESLRRRLGQGGRERFTDQFRHQHMTREIRKLYERLLAAG
jgi:glycosyltransferase involved in cell wall biosynthesis